MPGSEKGASRERGLPPLRDFFRKHRSGNGEKPVPFLSLSCLILPEAGAAAFFPGAGRLGKGSAGRNGGGPRLLQERRSRSSELRTERGGTVPEPVRPARALRRSVPQGAQRTRHVAGTPRKDAEKRREPGETKNYFLFYFTDIKDYFYPAVKKMQKKSFLPLFNFKTGLIYGSSPGAEVPGVSASRAFYFVLCPASAGKCGSSSFLQQSFWEDMGNETPE